MESLDTAQRRAALDDYLSKLEVGGLEPSGSPLPYDAPQGIDDVPLCIMGFHTVTDELRELTNSVNAWHGSLKRWNAWNLVLASRDESLGWAIQWEFVEPLVHQCLFSPSAVRDRFTTVATNALHQIQLAAFRGRYKDTLLGDPEEPGEKSKYPSRREKEGQLGRFARVWPTEGTRFMQALRALDGAVNRTATADFRNRASHGIAPRLSVGYTHTVTREVVQATELKEQADGTYLDEPIPDKLCVQYGFGGLAPLNLVELWKVNTKQFRLAEACFARYTTLLNAALKSVPPAAAATS